MVQFEFTKRNIIIIGVISILSLFTLWIRLMPEAALVSGNGVNLLGNDPWYTLRQVEQTVTNFPVYGWFDPMTQFPTGNVNGWGPLFVQIISFFALIAGASTRPEIMYFASWVPPLMAAAMVPLLYFIGKRMADWKTGLLASGLIAVVSGQYLYRSLFGFVDHHIAEVLFSTLFCLAYIFALVYTKQNTVDFKKPETLKIPVILSFIAGISYLLGLFTMPTMILFALIVAVFTVVQFIWDYYRSRSSNDLLLLNVIVFTTAIIGLLLFGLKHPDSSSLARYSIGHIYAYFAIVLGTGTLYGLSSILKGKPKFYYPLSLFGIIIIGSLILSFVSNELFSVIIGNFISFFGSQATTLTIQEARPWNFTDAWSTFHYGFILMVGGIGTLLYRNIKEEHPDQIFVLVWSVIILFSTIRHIRYEYYLAVNIALLSAIFIGFVLEAGWKDIYGLIKPEKEDSPQPVPEKKSKGKKKGAHKNPKTVEKTRTNYMMLFSVAVVVIFTGLFVIQSLDTDITIAGNVGGGMNSDWMESLEWMEANTPDTGVDYYAIYDQETFEYPPEAYGVMSWWDYGHWITFVGKRIPNANPFQHGVAGPNGSAAFFIQQSEGDSSAILENLGTKYVITDIEMDTGKFWAMATWYNNTQGGSPYQTYVQNQLSQPVLVYTDAYFQTMISRLHNFDGSMTEPDSQYVISYQGQKLSPLIIAPVEKVPALSHYRLVSESSTNVFNTAMFDLKYVKVFEYVPGARIKGEGVIEIPVETNTGRTFVYRQESINGEFVVPYATSGSPYDVKAKGKYKIADTDLEFDVPEEAIQNGLSIN